MYRRIRINNVIIIIITIIMIYKIYTFLILYLFSLRLIGLYGNAVRKGNPCIY